MNHQDAFESIWIHLEFFRSFRSILILLESLRISMDLYGSRWIPVDLDESGLILMDPNWS